MSEATEYISMAVGAIATIGIGVIAIWSTRQDRAQDQQRTDMNAMAGQINDARTRLTTIEANMTHVPGKEDMGKLHEKLNEFGRDMAEIKGSQATLLAVFQSSTPGAPKRRVSDRAR